MHPLAAAPPQKPTPCMGAETEPIFMILAVVFSYDRAIYVFPQCEI